MERKRQSRRDRIVQAAVAAIAEKGPAEFSLNQLARDLDYTPGALYWYFPSKEALVAEVQRLVLARLAEVTASARSEWAVAPQLSGEDDRVRCLYVLLRQALFYLRLEHTHREDARVLAFSVDPRIWLDAEQARELVPVLAHVLDVAAIPFQQAEQAGALAPGDAAQRGLQYWAANQGTVQLTKLARLAPTRIHPERLGMDSARSLLRGWGAPADALDRAWELASEFAAESAPPLVAVEGSL